MSKKYYITTPIYYVNDKPHIGHAYTTLACDVIARFKRLDGYKVKFLTGTDEHGQKVEKSANKAGVSPQEFTDQVSEGFRNLTQVMGFSNDDFIRTTEKRHKENAVRIWHKLKDYIYLDKYSGWYSVRDEAFYDESELVDGKAPTGAEVQWVEEESYFFKLSLWEEELLAFYEANPTFIAPKSRRNEVLSFVKGRLKDLCISRISFNWGVKVPDNPAHVMYVWLDALTNYISALDGYEESEFWPCDLHVVGKDILRFHAVYWPAFLMAAGIKLPKRIFAHGWWTNEGQKISKSLGNTIDPVQLVEEYGVDYVRYFLMKEIPFGNDGNFSRDSFVARINSELVNNVGNLAQRVLSFINKHNDGVIPENSELIDQDHNLLAAAYATLDLVQQDINNQVINGAIEKIIKIASLANEYIDTNAPWTLRKTDRKRMEAVLYTLAEVIRVVATLLNPLIPQSSGKLLEQLGISEVKFSSLNAQNALRPGTTIAAPSPIFPRLV